MNRPPLHQNMMGCGFRSPRPYNWRPHGPRPNPGYQWRPNFSSPVNSNTNNEEHWCETCDRGFPTEDQLNRHKQQHQKCNIDGCQFVAHPKVITKHIQMQHSSGLYKKIAKLDNPEEIQKWREERKKKYPTRVNIEKKAAECKEKIERGEKMALKNNRPAHQQTSDHSAGIKRKHSFDNRNQNNRSNRQHFNSKNNNITNKDHPPKKIPKVIPKIPSTKDKNKLKPFAGILTIEMLDDDVQEHCYTSDCDNSLIEDENEEIDNAKEKPAQEPILCGALSSLMCEYASSDEDTNIEDIANTTTKNTNSTGVTTIDILQSIANVIKNNVTNDNQPQVIDNETKLNGNDDNSDDDSGPEEVKIVKCDVPEPNAAQEQEIIKKKDPPSKKHIMPPRKDYKDQNKYKHKVPSTLLQKLLGKEIRQERNMVLQCIRYIKKSNYFDKP